MIRPMKCLMFCAAIIPLLSSISSTAEMLTLPAQHQVKGSGGVYRLEQKTLEWEASETAIIVCDMWDKHWCAGATGRVAEMAPTMEAVLKNARDKGVIIIHAPSDTLGFYEDSPQRQRAKEAKHKKMPSRNGWRHIQDEEGPLPIDDSDGGCDDQPACKNYKAWTRQIDILTIAPEDYISAVGQEVYNILEANHRDNVIIMGVHTNMCVLGRPFSIRANVSNGKNVVLMKDMTDSMYNSRMAPFVPHFRGTELVTEHIERHWAPTITSTAFTGKTPFRFADDPRKHAVFLIHEDEYDTKHTLPEYAQSELVDELGWKCTYLFGDGLHNIPNTEAIAQADLLFISVRRQVLPKAQLEFIKAHIESGKPIVAIRTASHAFSSRSKSPAAGLEWPEFDHDVLGGNYHNHYGNKSPDSPRTYIWSTPEVESHPILAGISPDKRITTSWLYKVNPLTESATPIMWGQIEGHPPEPVAWTNINAYKGRVFYTSLGHPDDFASPDFRKMLTNSMQWVLKK
ncbi:MAG: ThuA domain-containing protein [Candidatus Hydrogenedentota bacterium]